MASSSEKPKDSLIERGNYGMNYVGTATFVGLRAVDPLLQYQILRNDWGESLVQRLGGTTLPKGPPLVSNTPLDVVGLSPYRSILFAMSVGAMVKHNFHHLTIGQEAMGPAPAAMIGAFNISLDTLNSLLFVCSQTSASVNGEHFPQTPLIVGASLYTVGLTVELASEIQRAAFKKDPKNKGKVYQGGLFGLSRHINYFGYLLWRTGYALTAGGWVWGTAIASLNAAMFVQSSIPELQSYLESRYGQQYEQYKEAVPYKFVPYIY